MVSSSEINRRSLVDPDIIVAKYKQYHVESKVSILAQLLAQKSYFGDAILGRCTVGGCKEDLALPIVELNQLKGGFFNCFLSIGWTPSSLGRHGLLVHTPLANAANGSETTCKTIYVTTIFNKLFIIVCINV